MCRNIGLKIDMRNAFNSLRREHIIEKSITTCPKISRLIRCAHYAIMILLCSIVQDSLQGLRWRQDVAWTIATIPVEYGDLGLRVATDIALPAYLVSTAVSSDLVDFMLS